MADLKNTMFGQLAINAGYVNDSDIQAALRDQQGMTHNQKYKRIAEILVGKGCLTIAQAIDILEKQKVFIFRCSNCSKQYNVPFADDTLDYFCPKDNTKLEKLTTESADLINVDKIIHFSMGSPKGSKPAQLSSSGPLLNSTSDSNFLKEMRAIPKIQNGEKKATQKSSIPQISVSEKIDKAPEKARKSNKVKTLDNDILKALSKSDSKINDVEIKKKIKEKKTVIIRPDSIDTRQILAFEKLDKAQVQNIIEAAPKEVHKSDIVEDVKPAEQYTATELAQKVMSSFEQHDQLQMGLQDEQLILSGSIDEEEKSQENQQEQYEETKIADEKITDLMHDSTNEIRVKMKFNRIEDDEEEISNLRSQLAEIISEQESFLESISAPDFDEDSEENDENNPEISQLQKDLTSESDSAIVSENKLADFDNQKIESGDISQKAADEISDDKKDVIIDQNIETSTSDMDESIEKAPDETSELQSSIEEKYLPKTNIEPETSEAKFQAPGTLFQQENPDDTAAEQEKIDEAELKVESKQDPEDDKPDENLHVKIPTADKADDPKEQAKTIDAHENETNEQAQIVDKATEEKIESGAEWDFQEPENNKVSELEIDKQDVAENVAPDESVEKFEASQDILEKSLEPDKNLDLLEEESKPQADNQGLETKTDENKTGDEKLKDAPDEINIAETSNSEELDSTNNVDESEMQNLKETDTSTEHFSKAKEESTSTIKVTENDVNSEEDFHVEATKDSNFYIDISAKSVDDSGFETKIESKESAEIIAKSTTQEPELQKSEPNQEKFGENNENQDVKKFIDKVEAEKLAYLETKKLERAEISETKSDETDENGVPKRFQLEKVQKPGPPENLKPLEDIKIAQPESPILNTFKNIITRVWKKNGQKNKEQEPNEVVNNEIEGIKTAKLDYDSEGNIIEDDNTALEEEFLQEMLSAAENENPDESKPIEDEQEENNKKQ